MPLSLLRTAQLSRLSYELPHSVRIAYETKTGDANTVACMQDVAAEPIFMSDPETDVQAYAMLLDQPEHRTLVVTVRGTSSLIDAFHDLSGLTMALPAAKLLAPGVRVHSGFLCQYGALAPMLQPVVTRLVNDGEAFDMLFTGHSAGAAIGALAALHASLDHTQSVHYVGFGSPRVGNGAFCALFKQLVPEPVLIKHSRDPISKVIDGFGYQHICEMTCYGKFDVCPQLPLLIHLPDHDIVNYVAAIQKDDKVRAPTMLDKAIQACVSWVIGAVTTLIK